MFGGNYSGHPAHTNNNYEYPSVGQSLQNAGQANSHKCTHCGWSADVDDYQKETPNWCERCESVTTFRRIE